MLLKLTLKPSYRQSEPFGSAWTTCKGFPPSNRGYRKVPGRLPFCGFRWSQKIILTWQRLQEKGRCMHTCKQHTTPLRILDPDTGSMRSPLSVRRCAWKLWQSSGTCLDRTRYTTLEHSDEHRAGGLGKPCLDQGVTSQPVHAPHSLAMC